VALQRFKALTIRKTEELVAYGLPGEKAGVLARCISPLTSPTGAAPAMHLCS